MPLPSPLKFPILSQLVPPLLLLLLLLVVEWGGQGVCQDQCVEMVTGEGGWKLVSPGVRMGVQVRSLLGCQSLCVHWSACQACSFHPTSRLCLLSPLPPSTRSALDPAGDTVIISVAVNATDCQRAGKGACYTRPCETTQTCLHVSGANGHLCLRLIDTEDNQTPQNEFEEIGNFPFDQAEEACRSRGLRVLSSETEEKMALIRTSINKTGKPRIWLNARLIGGVWIWLHTQVPIDILRWNTAKNQPDGNEDCLTVNTEWNFLWHDMGCQLHNPTVCEKVIL